VADGCDANAETADADWKGVLTPSPPGGLREVVAMTEFEGRLIRVHYGSSRSLGRSQTGEFV
jgi:hypothetical protein